VVEEAPAPGMTEERRGAMGRAACDAARAIGYVGAGTVEFIVDAGVAGKEPGESFHFMEMNTRLQVEHPVTEWVTGVDLVAMQLLLAAGELGKLEIPARIGASIEVRLYAEDPQNFLPAPGAVGRIHFPSGAFVRVDTAITEAGEVSMHYDPMIAKISVWGRTREEAIGRLRVALDETRVEPPTKRDGTKIGSLKTNLEFLQRLVRHPDVLGGDTTTDLIARNADLTRLASAEETAKEVSIEAAVALSLHQLLSEQTVLEGGTASGGASTLGAWPLIARREAIRDGGGR
jgi:acetyl/propionyl-CoA carboxylase alpha subunit